MELIRNTRFIGFEATKEFAEHLKRTAKSEHRSMASYMKHVLCRELKFNGIV